MHSKTLNTFSIQEVIWLYRTYLSFIIYFSCSEHPNAVDTFHWPCIIYIHLPTNKTRTNISWESQFIYALIPNKKVQ